MARDIMKRDDKKLHGLTLGHLVVASLMLEHRMEGKGKNVQTALDEASALMATRGRVIADSLVPHDLVMRDGNQQVYGEHLIDRHIIQNPDDVAVWVSPSDSLSTISVPANPVALEAIAASDVIVVGPGSEYTSNIPPFLAEGMPEAMQAREDDQQFIIVANLAKEETTGPTMTGLRYVSEVERYAGRRCTRIVYNHNTDSLEDEAFSFEREELDSMSDYDVIAADLVDSIDVQHDPNNPLNNRSKVRTRMATAAIAALAEDPQPFLASNQLVA